MGIHTLYCCSLVEDTGPIAIEHRLTNLFFLLFCLFFWPFVLYYLTSTVSSTPTKSLFSELLWMSPTDDLSTLICYQLSCLNGPTQKTLLLIPFFFLQPCLLHFYFPSGSDIHRQYYWYMVAQRYKFYFWLEKPYFIGEKNVGFFTRK